MQQLMSQTPLLIQVLQQLYTAIYLVEMKENRGKCLFSNDASQAGKSYFSWDEFLHLYSQKNIIDGRQQHLCEMFSCAGMEAQHVYGKQSFSFTYPCIKEQDDSEIMVTAVFEDHADDCAYVLFHVPGQENLLSRIVDLYVYDTCDYFIYLDAKTDSYLTFGTSQSGTPLPPTTTQNYSEEIITYARKYVVAEDQDRVIDSMKLDHVVAQLDAHGVYSFTCGVLEDERGYTRKKVEYHYYNKKNKLILLSRTDITDVYVEQQRQVRELQEALRQARTDALTGSLNYQGIVDYVNAYLTNDDAAGAFIFLDLDNFKSVNDTYGHQTGDVVLKRVVKTLQELVSPEDYVARIGGDEFVVFIKGLTESERAEIYANRICQNIASLSVSEQIFSHISCSVGVVLAPQDGRKYAQLYQIADALTYESKKKGKNQYSLHYTRNSMQR